MQIALNDEERRVLLEVLNETLPDLREEVYKTENFDYRAQLKRREALLKSLLERLCAAACFGSPVLALLSERACARRGQADKIRVAHANGIAVRPGIENDLFVGG